MATTNFTEEMVRKGDLDVNGDRSLEEIGTFPETAKRIFLNDCTRVRKIHGFNEGMTLISVSHCFGLRDLPILPKSIEVFYAGLCWNLASLQDLHDYEKLRVVDFNGCFSLEVAPKLPNRLTNLYMGNCKGMKKLPELPQDLEVLDVRYNEWLTELPALPPNLKKLFVRGCRNLRSLPALPHSLEWLDVGDCPAAGTLVAGPQTTVYAR